VTSKKSVGAAVVVAASLVFAAMAVASASTPIHGKVKGHFASASSCFGCGEMVKYVKASNVWCAWQGENVIIHVRFHNTSVEHLTIHWHPSYIIRNGGEHGAGFGSLQDHGVDGHGYRGVFVKQKPEGVPAGSPIAKCKPSFSSVESG
jgi:hypothetical protein